MKEEETAESEGRQAALLFPLATGVSSHTDSVDQQGEMFSRFFVLRHLH